MLFRYLALAYKYEYYQSHTASALQASMAEGRGLQQMGIFFNG
ncbi:hypothetical protein [Veillonella intestinalis]|nr:hypothetical protein [Veillonella intestinalis]